jgi:hypothetical protein
MKLIQKTHPDIPKSASPVEQWWLKIRQQTNRQVPLETALSFPIPVMKNNELLLSVFYYGVEKVSGPGNSLAKPPVARLIGTYPVPHIVQFVTNKVEDLFPGLPSGGTIGPLVGGHFTPTERMKGRQELFRLYTPILALFSLKEETTDRREDFKAAFQKQAEPGLLPYYQALNPDFFDWLNKR